MMFTDDNKFMITHAVIDGRVSKYFFRVYYECNKYHLVSIKYNLCFCKTFEDKSSCEHLDALKEKFAK